MPSFGRRSRENLKEVHPFLVTLFKEVVKFYDCQVICGYRTPEKQKELYDTGFSRVLDSKHQRSPAEAIDVIPYPFTAADWKNTKRFYHFAGFVMATNYQMQRDGRLENGYEFRNGYDWDGDNDLDDQSFMDGCHFQLSRIPEKI